MTSKLPIIEVNAERVQHLHGIRAANSSNDAKRQEQRILEALSRHSATTFESSRHSDVYDSPARIFNLRKAGHKIAMSWVKQETEAGKLHRVGLYTLEGQA